MDARSDADWRSLLIGAGRNRRKKIWDAESGGEPWRGALVTVDVSPACGADVVHDMGVRPLPFADESFNEIHAYDCLEHWGAQGDWRAWFDEMAEYHRILRERGRMYIGVPIGTDHFADPGHTRFFSLNHFHFLNQAWYEEQAAKGTSAADYRWYWKKDFAVAWSRPIGDPAHHLCVVLEKR